MASWWDYGYQTTAMANRTVIVDNNTWNNTHIATVGRAMSSPERKAWRIFRSLDVDYVFVLFGGFIGCAIVENRMLQPYMQKCSMCRHAVGGRAVRSVRRLQPVMQPLHLACTQMDLRVQVVVW